MPVLSEILADEIELLKQSGILQAGELKILNAVMALSADVDAKQAQVVGLLTKILAWNDPPRVPTSLRIGRPRLINKLTGEEIMPGPYSATRDHDLKLDLIWADDVGPVAPLPGGTTITSDNVAVVASGDVAANDASAILRLAGDGTCNVTFANPGVPGGQALTVTEEVTVGEPVPSSLGTANPVAVPKGTPA